MFFKTFPDSSFSFDGETYVLEDLTRKVLFIPENFSNYSYVSDIVIKETRPDILSYELYENVNYWWSFFVLNNITFNDWPLTDEDLYDQMTERYSDFELKSVYRYVDENGNQVPSYGFPEFTVNGEIVQYHFDRNLFNDSNKKITRSSKTPQTLEEYLVEENDKKRNIRAVRPEFIGQFFDDFRKRIKSEVVYD